MGSHTAFMAKYPETEKTSARIVFGMSAEVFKKLGLDTKTRWTATAAKGHGYKLAPSADQTKSRSGCRFAISGQNYVCSLPAELHHRFMKLPGFGQSECVMVDEGGALIYSDPPERKPMILRGSRRVQPATKVVKRGRTLVDVPEITHDALLDAVRTVNDAFDQNGGSLILSIVPEGDPKTPAGHLRITREYN